MPAYEFSLLPPASAPDLELVATLTALINEVYAEGEKGLWVDGTDRTAPDEVAAFVAAGELAVARHGTEIVGAARLRALPTGEAEFGMLAVSSAHRGTGVGREMVAFLENTARAQGRTRMQLEILVPQDWIHPMKAFLLEWYTRIGYVHTRTGRLVEAYPHLAPHLATGCHFVIFHKNL